MQDIFLTDFTDPRFQQAFRQYFAEIGINVKNWDGLFQEMDGDGRGNRAWLRLAEGRTVGFIQFCPMEMTGWFFTQRLGFIREFWVAPEFRGQGHGRALLGLAEAHFRDAGFGGAILTSQRDAMDFYLHHGYREGRGFTTKNGEDDRVMVKELV